MKVKMFVIAILMSVGLVGVAYSCTETNSLLLYIVNHSSSTLNLSATQLSGASNKPTFPSTIAPTQGKADPTHICAKSFSTSDPKGTVEYEDSNLKGQVLVTFDVSAETCQMLVQSYVPPYTNSFQSCGMGTDETGLGFVCTCEVPANFFK